MSWADGILSVWSWGKQGLIDKYDIHLRPACPNTNCNSTSPSPAVPSTASSAAAQGEALLLSQ